MLKRFHRHLYLPHALSRALPNQLLNRVDFGPHLPSPTILLILEKVDHLQHVLHLLLHICSYINLRSYLVSGEIGNGARSWWLSYIHVLDCLDVSNQNTVLFDRAGHVLNICSHLLHHGSSILA